MNTHSSVEDRDHYYSVLGIPRNATQHDINEAYERLAYSHHPDREGNSMETYRSVTKAYHVLSDPNKRRQYDLDGIIYFDGEEYSGLDVTQLGGIGRVFGAMISRLGVPLPTQVSQDVLQTALRISRERKSGEGSECSEELVWGWSMDGTVGRQEAKFYRISVDQEKADNGFIVFCRSLKGKFKLVVFDAEGSALHIEESMQSRDKSQWETALYFLTAFRTYHLGTPLPPSLREQDLPAIFGSLDSFSPCNLSIIPGEYLICVYGDNFIGRTSYSLLAVPTLNDSQEATDVQEMDQALLGMKESLAEFKMEYLNAKEAFEKATRRLQGETALVEDLLERREYAYSSFMVTSANSFLPTAPSPPPGVKARLSASSSTASASTVQQVTATAVAASGWLTSRLAVGLGELNKYLESPVVRADRGSGPRGEDDNAHELVHEEVPPNTLDTGDNEIVDFSDR